jgi:hypothetical protein
MVLVMDLLLQASCPSLCYVCWSMNNGYSEMPHLFAQACRSPHAQRAAAHLIAIIPLRMLALYGRVKFVLDGEAGMHSIALSS